MSLTPQNSSEEHVNGEILAEETPLLRQSDL